jgi:hypothetical protein
MQKPLLHIIIFIRTLSPTYVNTPTHEAWGPHLSNGHLCQIGDSELSEAFSCFNLFLTETDPCAVF